MINLHQNIFNPNTFWDAWKTGQNINQTMFNFFELLSTKHKLENNTESLLKELAKECIAYFSEHAAIAHKLFMGLATINSPEDLIQLQHKVLGECNESHLNRTNKILNIYHELLQQHCKKNQHNSNNFSYNCNMRSEPFMSSCTKNQCEPNSNDHSSAMPNHCDCAWNSDLHNPKASSCNSKEQPKSYPENKCSSKKNHGTNKNFCNKNNVYDKNNPNNK